MIYRLFLPSIGGIQQHIFEISRELIKRGHQVTVLTTDALFDASNDQELIQKIEVKRHSHFYMDLSKSKDELDVSGGDPISIPMLKSLLVEDYDFIHVHQSALLTLTTYVASKIKRKNYFLTLHSDIDFASVFHPYSIIWKANILGASACLCVSTNGYRNVLSIKGKDTYHFPNGVNLEEFKNAEPKKAKSKYGLGSAEKIVLNVGRMHPMKGQDILVKAMPKILERFKDTKFVFCGPFYDLQYYRHLLELVRKSNLQRSVLFVGPLGHDARKDLIDLFAACDVFVLPSLYESFGLVVLESWAAKKPVVASKIDNISEIVEDNKTGILFQPNESLSLADAILKVLSDVRLAETLGLNGYDKALKEYTWQRVTDKLESIYNKYI